MPVAHTAEFSPAAVEYVRLRGKLLAQIPGT
jgi:hypothetical protein